LKKTQTFETTAGSYLLCLKIASPFSIPVGSLGIVDFQKGTYLYCGSARKYPGARLARHLKKNKKVHWHIDYLTSRENVDVSVIRIFPSERKSECGLNLQVQQLPGGEPISKFGCSDCSCSSHLTFFKRLPARTINRL
jgi:Uri superfamily endonuclease